MNLKVEIWSVFQLFTEFYRLSKWFSMNLTYKQRKKHKIRSIEEHQSDDSDLVDNSVEICNPQIEQIGIQKMINGIFPNELFQQYNSCPLFSPNFIKVFIEYCYNFWGDETQKLLMSISNGPCENSSRMVHHGILNFLISTIPDNLELIENILLNSGITGKKNFVEIGGYYVLCCLAESSILPTSIFHIFSLISAIEFDYFDVIQPPTFYFPITCNYDITKTYKFEDLFSTLILTEQPECIQCLLEGIKNIFLSSEKCVSKFSSLFIENFYRFIQFEEYQNISFDILLICIRTQDNFDVNTLYDLIRMFLFTDNDEDIHKGLLLFEQISQEIEISLLPNDIISIIFNISQDSKFDNKKIAMKIIFNLIDNSPLSMYNKFLEFNVLEIFFDFFNTEQNEDFEFAFNVFIDFVLECLCNVENEEEVEMFNDSIGIIDEIRKSSDENIAMKADEAYEVIMQLLCEEEVM